MKKHLIFFTMLLALILGTTFNTFAQTISRSGWQLHPVVSTTNSVYSMILNAVPMNVAGLLVDDSYSTWGYRFWPMLQQKYTLSKKIETPDGKAETKWWDWGMRSFSVGYTFGYLSYTAPLGFQVELNYEKQNWRAKLPKSDDYVDFAKQMFTPEVFLRIRLGSREGNLNFVLEPGVKYNYAFKARGEYNDKKYVNNGVTAIFGLGYYSKNKHWVGTVRYERDCFDFFNQDFVAPDGSKPYKDFTTKHGVLNFTGGLIF